MEAQLRGAEAKLDAVETENWSCAKSSVDLLRTAYVFSIGPIVLPRQFSLVQFVGGA